MHTLRKKYKRSPTSNNFNLLTVAEQDFQNLVNEVKASYESDPVHNFANHSNFKIYQYIRNITKSSTIPSTVFHNDAGATDDKSKDNLFNQYFFSVFTSSPSSLPDIWELPPQNDSIHTIYIEEFKVFSALSNLDSNKATGPDNIGPKILKQCATSITQPIHYNNFNLTLSYGMIPKEWKIHQIVPVFKSGDKSLVQNYRPISLLCNISKILEHIINNKIILFVSSSISHCQFGFLHGRSTIQQLLLFLNHICNSVSEGHQHDVIYMDFHKAFDSVPHNDLLTKLWSFGITGRLWQWFQCYLLNRQQYVKINNALSDLLPVLSGVPQSSILGPVLFLIYVNDLSQCIEFSTVFLFADDAKCHRDINGPKDSQSLQRDLDRLYEWSISNYISLFQCFEMLTTQFQLLSYHILSH